MTYGLRISASVFIYIYIRELGHVLSRGAVRVRNGVSGYLKDAVFEVVAHEESESWTRLPHSFTKEGLLQLPG